MAGGRAQSLGGCSILLEDVWASTNTPAALGQVKNFRAGVWTERRFNVRELSNGALAFAIPLGKSGVLGAGLYQFGISKYYTQQNITLSYGLKLSKQISAGVGMHVLHTKIDYYGSQITGIGELGFNYYPTQTLAVGLNIWNPAPAKIISYQDERLPTILRASAKKDISKNVILITEVSQQLNKPLSLRGGVEYVPTKNVELQLGVRTNPMVYSFGLGVIYQGVKLHIGFGVYEVLGASPDVSLEYIKDQK